MDEQSRTFTGATVNLYPDSPRQVPLIIQGDGSSRIELNKGGSNYGFNTGNLTGACYRDLVIHGVFGSGTPDCAAAITADYTNSLMVEDCYLCGLGVSATVVRVGASTWGHIKNCQMGGNTGPSCIKLDGGRGLLVENCTFYDYQTMANVYHSKTPSGVGSWIDCVSPTNGDGASANAIIVRDSQLDEGAGNGISVNGYKTFTSERNRFNVNNSGAGRGIYLTNVGDARIIQDHFGNATGDRPAIKLVNSKARVDGITVDHGVTRIEVDATSVLDIVNSPGVVVDAAAGSTVTVDGIRRKNGIVQIGR